MKEIANLDGLILILDVCHAGAGVRDVIKSGLDLRARVRLELLAGTYLRVARNGCFSQSLIDLMKNGQADLSTDYLEIRHAANAGATRCLPVQDPPLYTGYGIGQNSSDPGLWVSRNVAAAGHWPLSGTREGAQAVALTRSFQVTGAVERIAEALDNKGLTVVIGEAGSGKSSLVSALARPELVPFISDRFLSAVVFTSLNRDIAELAERLATQLNRNPEFKAAAVSYAMAFDDGTYKAQPAFQRLVLGPLRKAMVPVGERIRLVIDGVDQLGLEARMELLDLLAGAATDPLLKRVSFLISARPSIASELNSLPNAFHINLDRPRPHEVRKYLTRRGVLEDIVEVLVSHTWTWLELQLLTEVVSRRDEVVPLRDKPFSLEDLYDEVIASAAMADEGVHTLLSVLAAAGSGPNLPIEVTVGACSLIQAKSGAPASGQALWEAPRIRRIAANLGSVLVRSDPGTDDEQLGFFHETLVNHVHEQSRWSVSIEDGHRAILGALDAASDARAVAYWQTRGPDHLWAVGDYSNALTAVISKLGYRAADNRSLLELWTERARAVLPTDDADLLALRGHLARWTGEAGNLTQAVILSTQLLADRIAIFGQEPIQTLTTRSALARWLGRSGKVVEASKQYGQLLIDELRILGPNHPDTLRTRHELASLTGEAGNVTDAIILFTQLLQEQVKVLGPDHLDTLRTRHELASLTGEAGNVTGAIILFTQLLEDRIQALGQDHPDTLITRDYLAQWTGRAGKVIEAVWLYSRLLEDQLRLLGPDHPDTLYSRHCIAHWTGEAGNVADAVRQYRRLLEHQLRRLDPDHPKILETRDHLAQWTGERGKVIDAIAQYRQLLEDRTRILGPDHPETLTTRYSIALWTGKAGNLTDAISQDRRLLEDRTRILGPDHPETLNTRDDLASWTGEAGDTAQALTLFHGLLQDRTRILGPDHPETLTTRNNLASWTGVAGKAAEALSQFRTLLEDHVRILGPDHPDTLTTRNNLASWTGKAGKTAEALSLFGALLEDQVRILGPDHPDTLKTRNNLASWTAKNGKTAEALSLFGTLLEDQIRILGPDHPDTLTTRNNLASWTAEIGLTTEALTLFRGLLQDQIRILGSDHSDTLTTRGWVVKLEAGNQADRPSD